MQLREAFDEVAGPLVEEPLAMLKREFIYHLGIVEFTQRMVEHWITATREEIGA